LIEESGRIVAIDVDGSAWVETERRSVCAGCRLKQGCGSGLLSQLLGKRLGHVRAHNPLGAREGERVVLALAEGALVRGSLAVYLLPLLLMFAAAVLGERLSAKLGLTGEGLVALLGALGLGLGFAWVRRFSRLAATDHRYQPVIVKRLRRCGDDATAVANAAGEVR
jgi:sigma-E factor negative regulatory protein RseC